LKSVSEGRVTPDEAAERLRHMPFEDLGFAKLDHHRAIRCGFPEVIFCQGKTTEQIVTIITRMTAHGHAVLATRAAPEVYEAVRALHPEAIYHKAARAIVLQGRQRCPRHEGLVAVVSAGTSDQPVAEEARVTAEVMGCRTEPFYDVGVAGIHRLLAHTEALAKATVIIVVAGMEGALPTIVSSFSSVPVIGVPTSVGYGMGGKGEAALLGMLQTCSPGLVVVNIDNGIGAGATAALISRRCHDARQSKDQAKAP
ncbi:MAG: nickel pincer cofactor biosynthesis protein LarB, partial [Methanomassiliicoccales archaeon]|nr:nickel pincer cofactor biosynthesis protein LarB [Methanomassiliicoccales archaeon]